MAEPRLAYGMLSNATEDPFERAALRQRESVKPSRGRAYTQGTEDLLRSIVPTTPTDIGLTLALGPAGRVLGPLGRVGMAAGGMLLDPTEAQAGAAGTVRKLAAGVVPKVKQAISSVAEYARGRPKASAEEITRAAAESPGMTQPQLRQLYNELGLTGGAPSPLVEPALRSQPPEEIARVTGLKLADREMLSKLTPEQRKAFQTGGKLPAGTMLPSQEAAEPAKRAFEPVKKEVGRAEKAYDEATAAGRGPAPFFDPSLEALSRPSPVEQYPLPRVAPKVTERLEPAMQGGLRRIERAAANADPRDMFWYNIQEPLGTFEQQLGPELGGQARPAWVSSLAGTSMVNPIESNVRGSSYYLGKIMRGEPLPQVIQIEDPRTGKTVQTLAGAPPPGYGAKAQIQHAARVREYLANEADPVANAKPFSYRENLGGNYMPRTIDTHDIRNMAGMPYSLEAFGEEAGLLPGEYSALERLGGRAAARAGMPQAMQQGGTWIGGAEYTGLRSRPEPLVDVLNRRIHVTAAVHGETPQEAWLKHITGQRPLLGIAGGGLAGPLLSRAGIDQEQLPQQQ